MLYPDPQWQLLDDLWESFYPRTGLAPAQLRWIAALEATMPRFLRLLVEHRCGALRGEPLVRAFDIPDRRPARLRALYRQTRGNPIAMQSLAPTLAFAVLGQAKQDRRLTPERESRVMAELLTRWGLRRALRESDAAPAIPRALAA
jgi:hypothetical protein